MLQNQNNKCSDRQPIDLNQGPLVNIKNNSDNVYCND